MAPWVSSVGERCVSKSAWNAPGRLLERKALLPGHFAVRVALLAPRRRIPGVVALLVRVGRAMVVVQDALHVQLGGLLAKARGIPGLVATVTCGVREVD